MRDARDAEDRRLLENGEIDLLLGGWVETIRGRCVARMRGPVGEDVAQAVCERLWKELKAGKHRDLDLPFRVVVGKVIGWTCAGWYDEGWGESELLEPDGLTPDTIGDLLHRLLLEEFVESIPPGDREVAQLWLLDRLEPDQIARALDKNPNAIYQAKFRITARLRPWLTP